MDQAIIFPRYESYQDSGFDWLGEIPANWSLETIRAVTQLKSEKGQPDLQVLSVYREYGVIPKDSRADNHNATSLDTSGYKVVREGDLVINKMKAWQGSMGVSEHAGIVSPAYITCRVNSEQVYPKFLHYLLRSQPYIGVYNSLSYGVRVGQWDMHYEDFKHILVPLPDLNCQQRIANFLDQRTAEIDEAIAKKQRLIELLKEQKAILINQAVTKGLNPDVPMRDSGVEWIGEVPAHWDIKRVKHMSNFITSGPRGWADYFSDEGAFFLQSGNLTNSIGINLGGANRVMPPRGAEGLRTRLKNHDVLVCITGANTGRVALAEVGTEEVYINQHLCLIRPRDNVDPEYLAFCLHSNVGKTHFFLRQYGLKEGLGLEDIKNSFVLVPPIDEQKILVEKVKGIILMSDNAILSILSHIDALNKYKATIISEAATGKVKI